MLHTLLMIVHIVSATCIVALVLVQRGKGAVAGAGFGAGASGNLDYNVQPQFENLARQIGGLRLWMGAQHTGSFKADDVLVTYSEP